MPPSPTAPSATTGGTLAAAPDGSTLKVTSPAIVAPIDGVTVESRTPTVVWANSNGHYGSVGLAYEIQVSSPSEIVYTRVVGESPNTGSHKIEMELTPNVVYSWRLRAALGNLVGPWSIWADFKVPAPVVVVPTQTTGGTGFRTPDPPPGQRLPRINQHGLINRVASQNGAALRNSCQEHGGSWLFMDIVVDELQALDLRWGYNAKRGNMGDPSVDVVSYHHGAGPSEGSTQVYIIDIINGHCGPNPSAGWSDVTEITYSSGTVGRYMFRRPGRR
ncbi:MAG: fibronectin type III domain-containing protein [Acidobacteriota bacterium]|nr:fibronectin type III domain-containing protein [Acidobacteriota bacterium]